jgi:hypothetical protein
VRNTPPTKIAKVVPNGKYIPTATSMGLFTHQIIEMPNRFQRPPATRAYRGLRCPTRGYHQARRGAAVRTANYLQLVCCPQQHESSTSPGGNDDVISSAV